MKLSPFQQQINDLLKDPDAQLSNHYEGENAPYRAPDGMQSGILFPNIHTYRRTITVPYRTIAVLLRAGVLEESHRVASEAQQGILTWESTTIYYRVKEHHEASH